MAKKTVKIKRVTAKKEVTPVTSGRIYVTATFNNTVVTLTNNQGHTLWWSSSGSVGFKGTRKATPYAAIKAMEGVIQKAKSLGMSAVEVYIKGPGPGRDATIRALRGVGLNVVLIADVTPMPHNGPRAKKRRRT